MSGAQSSHSTLANSGMSEREPDPIELNPGDHVCPVGGSKSEQLQLLAGLVRSGLASGNRFVIALNEEEVSALLPALLRRGVDSDRERRRGALDFVTDRAALAPYGDFQPQPYLNYLERQSDAARDMGFSGACFSAINGLAGVDAATMLETESGIDKMLKLHRLSVICVYDRAVFDTAYLHDAIRTHTSIALRNRCLSNPYFEPPDQLLHPPRESVIEAKRKRLGWWLAHLDVLTAAEEERERRVERIGELRKMEALARLAGGLSHDFNNLLTTISGFTDLLTGELAPGTPAREYADQVLEAASRSASLTEQLLTFSRRQVIRPARLDLRKVVENCVDEVDRMVTDGIALEVSLGDEPVPVESDAAQLHQMLMNLVANACEAMPVGGTLSISVGMRELEGPERIGWNDLPSGCYATLTVRDSGVGIAREVQPFIYDPFFTTRTRGKRFGLGLGLASVYGIVQQNSGAIDLESAPGEGSALTVLLPVSESAAPMDADRATRRVISRTSGTRTPTGRSARTGEGATVLLLDHHEAVRGLLAKTLPRFGYRVVEVSDGESAIETLRGGERIDLVLTNAELPGLDSTALSALLRSERPDLPIVFMVAYADEIPERTGEDRGGGGEEREGRGGSGRGGEAGGLAAELILKKPFRSDDLRRVLEDAFKSARRDALESAQRDAQKSAQGDAQKSAQGDAN